MNKRINLLVILFLSIGFPAFPETISDLFLKAENSHQEAMRILDCSEWDKGPFSEKRIQEIDEIRIKRIPSVVKRIKKIEGETLASPFFLEHPETLPFFKEYFKRIKRVAGLTILMLHRRVNKDFQSTFNAWIGQMIMRNIFQSYSFRFGLDPEFNADNPDSLIQYSQGKIDDEIWLSGVYIGFQGNRAEILNPFNKSANISEANIAMGITLLKKNEKIVPWAKILLAAPGIFKFTENAKKSNLIFQLKRLVEGKDAYSNLISCANRVLKINLKTTTLKR